MKAKVNFKLGNATYQLEIEEPSEMDTLHKMAVLANPPTYCDVCKNTQHFTLDSNKDKDGNVYVNVLCKKSGCYAKAKLGQYKSKGYFWKKFEKWNGGNQAQTQDAPGSEDNDEAEIPF